MEKNYFTYPSKVMNITQAYTGNYSHHTHTVGTPKDYPIDEAGDPNEKISAMYCNCDELEIVAIRGVENPNVTNTVWLYSTSPVVTPTFTDHAFITFTHSDDEEVSKLSVGQKFKRGDIIIHEGTNGNVTGPHVHIVVGRGKSDNWTLNTSGKWVMTGDTKKPEEVMYVDTSFTRIYQDAGLHFQIVPKEVSYIGTPVMRNTSVDQAEVKVEKLRARKTPNGEVLGYINLGIYNIWKEEKNGDYNWLQVEEDKWIAYQEDWVTLYPKVSSTCEDELATLKREKEAWQIEEQALKEKITNYESQIQELNDQVTSLNEQMKELTSSSTDEAILTYMVSKSDTYYLYLEQDEILKLYKRTSV